MAKQLLVIVTLDTVAISLTILIFLHITMRVFCATDYVLHCELKTVILIILFILLAQLMQ